MTTQVTVEASVEQRLASIESRLSALEATMTLFITEQREWRHEVNARFDRVEDSMGKMQSSINRLYFATFSVVGALAIAVIAASIFA